MKMLYLDCFAGISGDMTVAALLDLGVPLSFLRERLALLPFPPSSFTVEAEPVERKHIRATGFAVTVAEDQPHRHYGDIRRMIDGSGLNQREKELSQRIFLRLAEAEAKVHGVELENVHFHEVGAVDSIVDIVGTAICLDYLGVEEVYVSSLPLGSGFVETAHGRLPVPAPATAELLKGREVHQGVGPGERVTPTGAAIVAALAFSCTYPTYRVTGIGCGAGTKDFPDVPNILRAFLGETTDTGCSSIYVIETHVDDINPEILGFLMDHLLASGALDVAFGPLQMKKNRPATKITVVCEQRDLDRLAGEILRQSSAIGVRYYPVQRMTLERRAETRTTSLGDVAVKVVSDGDMVLRVTPEYEECLRIAREKGLPLQDVYRTIERETSGV